MAGLTNQSLGLVPSPPACVYEYKSTSSVTVSEVDVGPAPDISRSIIVPSVFVDTPGPKILPTSSELPPKSPDVVIDDTLPPIDITVPLLPFP